MKLKTTACRDRLEWLFGNKTPATPDYLPHDKKAECYPIHENSRYKKLKTKLSVCRIGGLFLALYKNEYIIDMIIEQLKKDLPEYFIFQLQMNPQKVAFPTFFEQSFEQTGKKSNIFHVTGIETLPSELKYNFIDYLQYTRERFKAKPYSLVFWMTPLFEKQLFFSAPDFYHWLSGTYDFSKIQIDNEPLKEKDVSTQSVSLDNIVEYLKKVIWQYEHWQELKGKEENFLLEVMRRANLYEYYVPSYCTDKNGKELLLDDLFEKFLSDNTKYFLTLLGDFGTGKSSFSLYYYIHIAKQYLQNRKGRIPIFISLKDYQGKLNIEDFIVKEFYEKYGIELSFGIFQELALSGKFVFFVDGFDEMASLSDMELTKENLRELTKLSFENILFMTNGSEKPKKANKIFLTCRTHYFLTQNQEKEILQKDYTVLYRNYATKTAYEITRINLKQFNEKQIEQYVYKNTKDRELTKKFIGIIKDTYNLEELSTRPLLLEMIVRTLPELENRNEINASMLYRAYTEIWINRDDWRSHMKPEGKRAFMWELAKKMFWQRGDFSLHYTKLDKPKEQHLKNVFEKTYRDYYMYETTTCTFLNRNPNGNYKFIHKSFMEYFIAEYFFDLIKNRKKRTLQPYEFNKEIEFFLKLLTSSKKSHLQLLDLTDLNLSKTNLTEANFKNANLTNVTLIDANLRNADLRNANLRNADLSNADLSNADLCGVNLKNAASLRGINLSRAILSNVDLKWINLSGANLSNTDLGNKDLSNADLSNADLSGVNLKNAASLRGINLSRANLSDVDLKGINLDGANLSYTDLSNADLSNADLSNADLSNAEISSVTIKNTANLSRIEHRGAD
ncbi:MAG: hypothetical protein GY795_04060 [Desulfobacterales bacterium]|nr:hypothetical protein [Desulfobacterales bacterium]